MPGSQFTRRHVLLLLLVLASIGSYAQIGLKISYASPLGDFGATYKKGLAYDLYYYQSYDNPKIASRAGIYYTSLKPRLDSFPVAFINTTSDHIAIPGAAVYKNFSFFGVYIEHSVRIAYYKRFSAWAGAGLMIGTAHNQYTEYDLSTGTPRQAGSADIADFSGGFRTRLALNYRPNDDLSCYFEAMNLALSDDQFSQFSSHNNFGFGINFFFHAEDNNECDEN